MSINLIGVVYLGTHLLNTALNLWMWACESLGQGGQIVARWPKLLQGEGTIVLWFGTAASELLMLLPVPKFVPFPPNRPQVTKANVFLDNIGSDSFVVALTWWYARTDLCKTHCERWIEISFKEAEKKRDAKRDTKQLARLIAHSPDRPAWQHEYHGTLLLEKLGVEQQTNIWVDLVTMSIKGWTANVIQFWVVKTIIWPCSYLCSKYVSR